MKPTDLLEIPSLTANAIRDLPKSWQKLNKAYFQQITRKEVITLNILAILVGIAAGYGAIGFRLLIGSLQNFVLHEQWDYHLISPINHTRGYWLFLILPLALLISTLITRFLAPETKGHGVPEVIEAVWTRNGRMRKRIVFLKAIASSITIAAGGSVGREGPIVQIGSAAGSALGQLLKVRPKLLKTLIGCGAAGAIGATFNTPIGGVIFAIEIIVLELKTKSFVPLVISSVFATVISRYYLGNEPAFLVSEYTLDGPKELFFYLILGVLSGCVGVLVIKSVYGFEDFFNDLKMPYWIKPIGAGLVLAAIGLKVPEVLGVGYDSVSQVLQQNSSLSLMLLLLFLKIFCTSLTLGGGGSGGVFAPSLFIGAMLGGSYGLVVHQYFPDITTSHGAYALVGMAAMFSATGRATFTAIVILFEMTLDYSIILPLMFVCVAADQTSWALLKESIYSLKLKRKGLKFATDISVNVMSMTLVKEIMTKNVIVALREQSVEEAALALLAQEHTLYPVVDSDGGLSGVLFKEDLLLALKENPKALVDEVKKATKAVVYGNDSVQDAVAKVEKVRDPRVLVIDGESLKLIGIVSPIDFVRLTHADS